MQFNISRFSSKQTAREQLYQEIDTEAGIARARYITTAPGQSDTYMEKERQAVQCVSEGYPDDVSHLSMIQAEVDWSGMSVQAATDSIMANSAAWRMLGAEIERIRLAGKKMVDESNSIRDMSYWAKVTKRSLGVV